MKSMQILEAMTNIDGSFIENAKPIPKKRSIGKIILVAALIAALAMSAFAAEEISNWFHAYFQRNSEVPLTEEQIAFIDENTIDQSQSQTYHGYTLAVESAISDGIYGYIKLKLTAPEHVVLDAESYYPGNPEYLTTEQIILEDSEEISFGFDLVEDNDALSNTVSLMVTISGGVADRSEWNLHIKRIMATYFENPGTDEYRIWDEIVAVGPWDFDIIFSETGKEELEFITKPVPGRVNVSLEEPIYMDVNITSLKLRAMSAEITYEFIEPFHAAGDFDDIYVVMKDGSREWVVNSAGNPGCCLFRFRTPIILEEVSHILLPDGTKLPIP